jgi:hypothetical protein
MPDTGTQTKANPEDGPVMKAVQRLTVKGDEMNVLSPSAR